MNPSLLPILATTLSAALLLACDPGSGPTTRDAGPDEDAAEACQAALPLELGRCVSMSGAPCTGAEPETRFDPMTPDDTIAPLIGPQASTMFALAARTNGIYAGDPARPSSSDNPVVDLRVFDESGREIARLRTRSAFRPSDEPEGAVENSQLFVVLELSPAQLARQDIRASAILRDRDGEVRCGELAFRTP